MQMSRENACGQEDRSAEGRDGRTGGEGAVAAKEAIVRSDREVL